MTTKKWTTTQLCVLSLDQDPKMVQQRESVEHVTYLAMRGSNLSCWFSSHEPQGYQSHALHCWASQDPKATPLYAAVFSSSTPLIFTLLQTQHSGACHGVCWLLQGGFLVFCLGCYAGSFWTWCQSCSIQCWGTVVAFWGSLKITPRGGVHNLVGLCQLAHFQCCNEVHKAE